LGDYLLTEYAVTSAARDAVELTDSEPALILPRCSTLAVDVADQMTQNYPLASPIALPMPNVAAPAIAPRSSIRAPE